VTVVDGRSAELRIIDGDVRDQQLRRVLATHLAFAQTVTEPGFVHALDEDGIDDPALRFSAAYREDELVGIGALRPIDHAHVEVKSMHVLEAARGTGVGRALLDHLLRLAAEQGFVRVSLETGTAPAFAAARQLYLAAGFAPCPPFGTYVETPHNVCMTRALP
jgi:putative acetyltransferase